MPPLLMKRAALLGHSRVFRAKDILGVAAVALVEHDVDVEDSLHAPRPGHGGQSPAKCVPC
jgi:hypothetical protein